MPESPANAQALLGSLPPPWPEPLLKSIRARFEASRQRFVILDDDPTGGQTVHNVPVLTEWSVETLAEELDRSPVFFLLTNSRALLPQAAGALARDIGRDLREAARRTGRDFVIASRSDSTLRGHFPCEVDALCDALADDEGAEHRPTCVLVPYFAEGGRFTIGDVQYIRQGNMLVPSAQTEFARDPMFPYTHSHLPGWVEEKTAGRVPSASVVSISLSDVRTGGPAAVADKLIAAPDGGTVIVNAAADRDLEVFVAGLLDAEAAGKRFVYRCAASFVRVRAGIAPKPLLTGLQPAAPTAVGGLVVVGSYVARTSEQLAAALALPGVKGIELSAGAVLDGAKSEVETARRADDVERALAAGEDVVLYTSRAHRAGATPSETASIAQAISGALCTIVRGLGVRPRFLIAKGGMTSSNVAIRALGVRRALVLGQLLPGVPVWQLAAESKFPGMSYVIFPGNVGEPNSLAEAISLLRGG